MKQITLYNNTPSQEGIDWDATLERQLFNQILMICFDSYFVNSENRRISQRLSNSEFSSSYQPPDLILIKNISAKASYLQIQIFFFFYLKQGTKLRFKVVDEGNNIFFCINNPKIISICEIFYCLWIYDILLSIYQAASKRNTKKAQRLQIDRRIQVFFTELRNQRCRIWEKRNKAVKASSTIF